MAEWLQDVSIGKWYRTDGEPFEIVGVDASAEIVLVQHYDGTLEEYEFDAWLEMAARPCAAPEDYSGALDIESADYGVERDDAAPGGTHRDHPLDLIDLRDY